jgi:TPR repeat protein
MKRYLPLLALILPLCANAGIDEGLEAASTGDYARAVAEIKPLADKGDAQAQYYMGYFHHYGYLTGKPDETEAANWFLKAAEQGEPRAQNYLGMIYEKGEGPKKDLIASHMWRSISAANPKAAYRDSLYTLKALQDMEGKMKPEEIARAREMAESWKPKI